MSNWKNLMKGRIHKERSQLSARSHLGLLEKKKDYVVRAKDYHRKEKAIQSLKLKAALKNQDEFYHQMHNAKLTKNGVHVSTKTKSHTAQELKELKNQDIAYLKSKLQNDQNRIAALKNELQGLNDSTNILKIQKQITSLENNNNNNNKNNLNEDKDDDEDEDDDDEENNNKKRKRLNNHVILFDDKAEFEKFTPENYFQCDQPLVNRSFNRLKKDQISQGPVFLNKNAHKITPEQIDSINNKQSSTYNQILFREDRKRKISQVLNKLEKQKLLSSKGPRKRVVIKDKFGDEDKEKSYFVWKQQRKK